MKNDSKPEGAKLGWHLRASDRLYKSQWYNLRQDRIILPNNEEITYSYIEHPGAVLVVPFTEDKRVILIRSYRYTIDDWCWEVPAGSLGDKSELSPETVACQELIEEIGGETEKLESLGWYYMANGFAQLKNYFFIAHNVVLNKTHQREASEIIEHVQSFSLKQALHMAHTGAINDGESAFAVILAAARIYQTQ